MPEIRELGGTALADTNSVAEGGGPKSIVQTALDAFGTVSVLVNNAGVISYAAFEDITVDQWNRMEAVTLGGAFWMCRAVWPVFMKNSYGRIVNTTSAADSPEVKCSVTTARPSWGWPARRSVSHSKGSNTT